MDSSIEILKRKIETFTPELAEAFVRIVDNLDTTPKSNVLQFQLDEVLNRIQFHSENSKTKLDFFKSIAELEKICA
ncbi:hypothetical protein [Chryseobacterium chendengshani]|uniref:hypothetical protein n=1 Tax=Chryseobacterium sp. LJ756 TaxID=2864113 RepID=UPI001C641747|nr:hypothetical protein [Chryseobacterium sp. LJ756]MBW7675969.1 hypothetical protein [Chryseobacterium sp. LJ756]